MTEPSIFESYCAVEKYFQSMEQLHGELPFIPVNIQPIDVFVLQQIAAFYATAPTIVDLASIDTRGVSLILWNKLEVRAVLPAYLTSQLRPVGSNEHQRIIAPIRETVDYLLLDSPALPLDNTMAWEETVGVLPPNSPIIVIIAFSHDSHADILSELNRLVRLMPSAVIAILPMGRVGTQSALAAAQLCAEDQERSLFLMSEVAFSLFSSELGFIYPKNDAHLLPAVERIKQLFTSNYDFLSILEMNFSLQQAYQKLVKERQSEVEKRLEAEQRLEDEKLTGMLAARDHQHALYRGFFGYFRGIYHAVVPLRLRLALRSLRVGIIAILRRIYHLLVPLGIRLKLRDIRVAVMGR